MIEKIRKAFCNADPTLLAILMVSAIVWLFVMAIIGIVHFLMIAAAVVGIIAVGAGIVYGSHQLIMWAQSHCRENQEPERVTLMEKVDQKIEETEDE